MKLDALEQKLKTFTMDELLNSAIRDIEQEVINLNTEDQLYDKGINADGIEIMSYKPYSPMTVQYKMRKGQPADRVTLEDTGKFHDLFYIIYRTNSIEFKSSDKKTLTLIPKYGLQVYGLTEDSIAKLREMLKPVLLRKIRNVIWT